MSTSAERMRRRRERLREEGKTEELRATRRNSDGSKNKGDVVGQSGRHYFRQYGEEWTARSTRPFVGCDAEGGEYNGRHALGCLTIGDETLRHEDGTPLSTKDVLDFMCDQPRLRRYVWFFNGYDVTMMLRDLPFDVANMIMRGDMIDKARKSGKTDYTWFELEGTRYGITVIPNKIFKVCRTGGGSFTSYDTAGYFQTAFVKALQDWDIGTEEERESIAATKKQRAHFVLPVPDDVVTYNVLECRLLADLLTKVDDTCRTLDIELTSYNGAGTIAKALLRKYDIRSFMADAPEEMHDAVSRAYFGGRFETSAIGVLPTVYEYDICSAYPAVIASLPCLACGRWEHSKCSEVHPSRRALYRISWHVTVKREMPWGPFPWRDSTGSLLYPLDGAGWYWDNEVRAAIDVYGSSAIHVYEAWEYVASCDHQPFAFVPELYAQRRALGKGTAGKVIKLGLNSLYGKLAQTVGGGGEHASYVWAGMITSDTRAKLLRIANLAGEDGVMMATDGFYTTRPLDIECGLELGDWEDGGKFDKFVIVQPGLYFTVEGNKVKTRGVSVASLRKTDGYTRLVEAWDKDGPEAVVEVSGRFLIDGEDAPTLFVGLRGALARRKPETAGEWVPVNKRVSFRPEPRRVRGEWENYGRTLRTLPPHHVMADMYVVSAPYRKMVDPVKKYHDAVAYEQPSLEMF